MKPFFEIAIVGGGPAGCAAALEAARLGLRAALFEPQAGGIDKPCGEGIMATGGDALAELGLQAVQGEAHPFDRIRYVVDGARALDVPLPRPGMSIERPDLQQRLDSALAARPQVQRFGERVHVLRTHRGYLLSSASGRRLARTLVVADGGGGRTAGWMRAASGHQPRLGLRARFEMAAPLESVEVHLGGPCEVYLTPLRGGRVNAALLFSEVPTGVRGSGALLDWGLEHMPGARRVLGELRTWPASRPLGRRAPHILAEGGAFLVGDAGGGADPILGCGLTIGLRSGIAAARGARCVVDGDLSGAPERAYASQYRAETRARRAVAVVLRRLAPHPFVLRRVMALGRRFPGALDPIVRIVAGEVSPRAA